LRESPGAKIIEAWQNWNMLGPMQQTAGEGTAPTYIAANASKAASNAD
jgi:hypothetical protein